MKELDDLVASDKAISLVFGFATQPGKTVQATLMTRGSAKWLKGYGTTATEALADLLRQMKPALPGALPGMPKLPGM